MRRSQTKERMEGLREAESVERVDCTVLYIISTWVLWVSLSLYLTVYVHMYVHVTM